MFSRYATVSRYSKHAAAAGYKPAPQLGRQIAVYRILVLSMPHNFYRPYFICTFVGKDSAAEPQPIL